MSTCSCSYNNLILFSAIGHGVSAGRNVRGFHFRSARASGFSLFYSSRDGRFCAKTRIYIISVNAKFDSLFTYIIILFCRSRKRKLKRIRTRNSISPLGRSRSDSDLQDTKRRCCLKLSSNEKQNVKND